MVPTIEPMVAHCFCKLSLSPGCKLTLFLHLKLSRFYLVAKASLVAQSVKNMPAIQETWFRSVGREDPLEKETATHSSILAWKISWTEEPGRLQSMGSQRDRCD